MYAKDLLKPETVEHYLCSRDQITIKLYGNHTYEDVLNRDGLIKYLDVLEKIAKKDFKEPLFPDRCYLFPASSGSWFVDKNHNAYEESLKYIDDINGKLAALDNFVITSVESNAADAKGQTTSPIIFYGRLDSMYWYAYTMSGSLYKFIPKNR